MDVEVLTVSTKGQVVLPIAMRRALGIENGTCLAAYATDDVIVLKPLDLPVDVEFEQWLDVARKSLSGEDAS